MKKQNLCSAAAELKKTMKISNSKKQLAKIIHENGGWRDEAKFSAQDKDGEVFHYATKPTINAGCEVWHHKGCIDEGEFTTETLPNWHQTILSRDEYFHLYPVAEAAPDADGWIEWKGGECPVSEFEAVQVKYKIDDGSGMCGTDAGELHWLHEDVDWDIVAYRLHKPDVKPEFCESVMRCIPDPEAKPTIEQLAQDYRNAKDYADRKQQEADAAKVDAEVKLAELVAAGKVLGLVIDVRH